MMSHVKQPPRLTVSKLTVLIVTVAGSTFTHAHATESQERLRLIGYQSLSQAELEKKVHLLRQQLKLYNRGIKRMEQYLKKPNETYAHKYYVPHLKNMKQDARATFKKYKDVYDTLKKKQGKARWQTFQTSFFEDDLLNELHKRLSELERRRADLLQRMTRQHPDFKNVEEKRKRGKNQIAQRMDGFMAGLKARVESARDKFQKLKREFKALRGQGPYPLKDRLKNMRRMRDSIHMKLMEAKLELKMKQAMGQANNDGGVDRNGKQ